MDQPKLPEKWNEWDIKTIKAIVTAQLADPGRNITSEAIIWAMMPKLDALIDHAKWCEEQIPKPKPIGKCGKPCTVQEQIKNSKPGGWIGVERQECLKCDDVIGRARVEPQEPEENVVELYNKCTGPEALKRHREYLKKADDYADKVLGEPEKQEPSYCCGSFERSFKDGVISPPLPGRHHHHIEAVQAKLVISNCPFCGSKLK